MRIWIASLLLAACHGSPPPAAPVDPPPQCAKVADHVVSLMSASKVVPDEQLDPFRHVISSHCDGDHWSSDAQQCMLSITSLAEGDNCKTFLTIAQLDAFNNDPTVAKPAHRDEEKEDKAMDRGGAVGGAAPPTMQPPPSPPPASRGPAPKGAPKKPKAGDPCEGGE